VAELRRFLDDLVAGQLLAPLVHLFEALDHVVDVALGCRRAGERRAGRVPSWPAPRSRWLAAKHDGPDLDAPGAARRVQGHSE
jgi:hypothetical protein